MVLGSSRHTLEGGSGLAATVCMILVLVLSAYRESQRFEVVYHAWEQIGLYARVQCNVPNGSEVRMRVLRSSRDSKAACKGSAAQ